MPRRPIRPHAGPKPSPVSAFKVCPKCNLDIYQKAVHANAHRLELEWRSFATDTTIRPELLRAFSEAGAPLVEERSGNDSFHCRYWAPKGANEVIRQLKELHVQRRLAALRTFEADFGTFVAAVIRQFVKEEAGPEYETMIAELTEHRMLEPPNAKPRR